MSQLIDNHPLAIDFPEHKATIHALKSGNSHFGRLFDEYEQVDRDIVRAEQGLDHLGDLKLDELKMRRVHLKDELYRLIQQASAQQP